jgi:hypothetical protein
MFQIVLLSLFCLLKLAAAAVLVWKYLRTRDKGFIFLGVAVFIWPVVSRLLQRGEAVIILRASRGQGVGFFPFSLVAQGKVSVGSFLLTLNDLDLVIGAGLLLIAMLHLSRTRMDAEASRVPNP